MQAKVLTMKKRSLALFCCFLFLWGCGATGPSRVDIEQALASKLPDGFVLQDVRFENIPSPDGASGRISVAGTLLTSADRYVNAADDYYRDLKSTFVSRDFVGLANDRLKGRTFVGGAGLNRVWKLETPSGTAIEFKADLGFRKEVDGWTITGYPEFERPEGDLAESFPEQGLNLIYGTEEFQKVFDQVILEVKREEERQAEMFKTIQAFFDPSHAIYQEAENGGGREFRLRPKGVMTLIYDHDEAYRRFGRRNDFFVQEAEVTWLETSRSYGTNLPGRIFEKGYEATGWIQGYFYFNKEKVRSVRLFFAMKAPNGSFHTGTDFELSNGQFIAAASYGRRPSVRLVAE